MLKMKLRYLYFLRGVSINKIGKTGVVLTTSSFITFVFLEFLRILGVLTNAYIGLITYLLLPTLFVVGLILIPISWIIYRRNTGKSTKELLTTRFDENDLTKSRIGASLVRTVLIFTIINILFLSIVSMRTLSFMDQAEFCGTACHSVMSPEWATYQVSPHSRVVCVECHVGEGADALISSKLNGVWQMVSASLDLYERPIPTPVNQLRPSRETCEKCHWPEKFYGSKLKTFTHYQHDEISTPLYSTLVLKIDTGQEVGGGGIHWHINSKDEISYASIDDLREEILWIENKQKDGSIKKFVNRKTKVIHFSSENVRIMDCVDCHNRATHIYENPSSAVDVRLKKGKISSELPFIKRESVGALRSSFTDSKIANQIIENRINSFYRRNYPEVLTSKSSEIRNAIKELQKIYSINVHFRMNIDWDTYSNHIGHRKNSGCFRCHNSNMVDETGIPIKTDCTLCHSILAYDSESPFQFLKPFNSSKKDSAMHVYLNYEFLNNIK